MIGRYIVVEGPIGVGKNKLVQALAQRLDAKMVRDQENPFLPSFYQNMEKFAFQSQVFFLLSRFQQQQDISQRDLFSSNILCDYLFQKDRLFASLTLHTAEFALYEKIYSLLKGTVSTPDVVIYLQANVDTLLHRIAKRSNDLALLLPRSYLENVTQAYQTFFSHYALAPVIAINTNRPDFAISEKLIDELIEKISTVKSGFHHLTPHES